MPIFWGGQPAQDQGAMLGQRQRPERVVELAGRAVQTHRQAPNSLDARFQFAARLGYRRMDRHGVSRKLVVLSVRRGKA